MTQRSRVTHRSRATHRSRGARLAAIALGLGLLITACGDSNDDASGPTTAGGAGGGAFKVNDASCPPGAKQALAAGAPIKLGISLPQTGPFAGFGVLGQGMKTYFEKVNAAGGVDGHKIELLAKDDAYEPARTTANVTEFLTKDNVLATSLVVGTPNNSAVQPQHEQACTPHLFVGTGHPKWGDPANHNWTTGGILSYNIEAKLLAEVIAKAKPRAKVAMLVFNSEFGKAVETAFKVEGPKKGLVIGEVKLHEATATTVDTETAALAASGADYIIGATSGAFCTRTMTGVAKAGYTGKLVMSATCAAIKPWFANAGSAANGVQILVQQKDPVDSQWASDPGVLAYKDDVAKYGGGADPSLGSVLTGYSIGVYTVEVLKAAAKRPGGLTRVNVMNAAWNLEFASPVAIGGKFKVDGRTDAYGAEYAELATFDVAKSSQVLTGDKFSLEGKEGVFKG